MNEPAVMNVAERRFGAERAFVILGLILLAVTAQVITYFAFPASWGPDGQRHALVAVNFLQRHPFDMVMPYDRTWVHPVIALSVAKALSSCGAWPFFQQILCALLLVPTFFVIRRSFGFTVAVVATAAIALSQPFLSSMRVWSSEGFFGLAIWGMLLCYLHALERPSYWSAAAAGLLAALPPMTRPTTEYWIIILLAGALLARMKKRHLAILFLAFLVPTIAVFAVNKARFGFFGYTWKLGRMAFFRAWDQDKSFSPENGPRSRRLYAFMEWRWPEIRARNPQPTTPYATFEEMYRDTFRLAGAAYYGQMYYLIVHEVRYNMPHAEADRLFRDAAFEAFGSNPWGYARNTLRLTMLNLGMTQERPRFFLAPEAPAESELPNVAHQRWRFELLPGYGQDAGEWRAATDRADAELQGMWPSEPAKPPAWAVRWNNRLRLIAPPQKVVVFLGLAALFVFAARLMRRRDARTAWVLVCSAIVFSHPLAIALFYGGLEMHNIPMIPAEIILAVIGAACLASLFKSLQARLDAQEGAQK